MRPRLITCQMPQSIASVVSCKTPGLATLQTHWAFFDTQPNLRCAHAQSGSLVATTHFTERADWPCVAEDEHSLQARRIILMAFGEGKAAAVAKTVEGPVTHQVGVLGLKP